MPPSRPPNPVALLGYGGLIPFVALAAALRGNPAHQGAWAYALITYGAVILSFVGALHWAFAMRQEAAAARGRFVWSVIPALVAWAALLLFALVPHGARIAAALLILVFIAHYLLDRGLAASLALPVWYLPLRGRLTAVACLCLATLLFID